MKRILILVLAVLMLAGCQNVLAAEETKITRIELSDEGILVDGAAVSADETAPVYAANDIVFYLAGQDFTYGEGSEADAHEQSEADAHTVVHITQPGAYAVSGKLSAGQIAVDLGKDAEEDPEAVVTLILDGVDISCSVAPAVIFYNVYECGEKDEETAAYAVDTSAAGANVIVADGTENNISGSYVARIYKSVELNEEGTEIIDSKKLHKYDAAFYSKMSMNVTGGERGDGILNIRAANEGLDSELHLTINGGDIRIDSGNDGINTNEDNISVTTVNGGRLSIVVNGATGEGDGIDSNGWLVINGGELKVSGCGFSGDAGIDSDKGIYLNSGRVEAGGNMFDHIAGGDADYAVFSFNSRQSGGSSYQMKNGAGETVAEWSPVNDFTYLVVADETLVPGEYTLWQDGVQLAHSGAGMGFGMMPGGMRFDGAQTAPGIENFDPGQMQRPEGMENFDPSQMQRPEGIENFDPGQMQRPEGMENFDPSQMQPPEGMENFDRSRMPRGENIPEMPDGQMNGMRGGRHGFDGMNGSGAQESVFVIAEGGNTFSGIATYTPETALEDASAAENTQSL